MSKCVKKIFGKVHNPRLLRACADQEKGGGEVKLKFP